MSLSSGWHHRLNGHEFEQTQGDSEGLGIQACCSPWCFKVLDTTEQLKNNVYKNFSTMFDTGLRKNIKKKKSRRDGEIEKYKLNEMRALKMKWKM